MTIPGRALNAYRSQAAAGEALSIESRLADLQVKLASARASLAAADQDAGTVTVQALSDVAVARILGRLNPVAGLVLSVLDLVQVTQSLARAVNTPSADRTVADAELATELLRFGTTLASLLPGLDAVMELTRLPLNIVSERGTVKSRIAAAQRAVDELARHERMLRLQLAAHRPGTLLDFRA